MWIAKFRIWHKNCMLRPKCVKYQVTDFVYLLSSWTDEDSFYYTELHILKGQESNKKKFVRALEKEEGLVELEQKGNYIFTLNKEHLEKQYYSPVFDPRIIYVKPVAQRKDGYEDWEVASWDKEPLMKIREVPSFEVELKSIVNENISEIFLPQVYPGLSPKQKEAIETAVEEGYYDYPRKTDLEGLAEISGVARQTFQEHLRKAEKKLVPFLTENIE